jgi:hypothetical protein
MTTIYHRIGISDSDSCNHAHATVISAVACIVSAGDYILALEDGVFRILNNVEQVEYEYAVYGRAIDRSVSPMEGYRKKRFS